MLDDGRPDRVAQVLAVILALPLALVPLLGLGLTALENVARFGTLGFWHSSASSALADELGNGCGKSPQF